MAPLRLLPLFLSLFVSLFLAEIQFSKIHFDNLPIIPFDKFGFTHTGHLELNVSNIDLSNQKPRFFQGRVLFLHQRCVVAHAPKTRRQGYLIRSLIRSRQANVYLQPTQREVKVSMTIQSVMFNLDGFEKNPDLERKKKG
ncbi:hypothetical protein SLEP1_g57437 [Rubroshorea leprosula]|uniref:CAND6/7 N-terminal domain-containing protein n=1 Tax=Rubroshorea leprosula TaxID=152421 RepID=A0AAV5MP31_9ROSI|nr:hypothetical protein SLEP1_g57437 [Rubroshorea leprosula]